MAAGPIASQGHLPLGGYRSCTNSTTVSRGGAANANFIYVIEYYHPAEADECPAGHHRGTHSFSETIGLLEESDRHKCRSLCAARCAGSPWFVRSLDRSRPSCPLAPLSAPA